jgi:hypothetical protein
VRRLAFSQLTHIANGVSYLKSTQNADGSWGGSAASLNGVFPTTAAVLETLKALEATTSSNQTNAIQFLTAQPVEENPFHAARIIALTGTTSNTAEDVNALLARQNSDGGWGTADGFESSPLDTAYALLALKAANTSNTTALINGLNYLTRIENIDGGWALTQGENSQVFYTAIALQALNSCRLQFAVSSNQTRAITFLRSRQNPDGGYGSPSSTAFETAQVALAMLGSGIPLSPAETAAINYLSNSQMANGSWADDAYSTALALRALTVPRDSDADGMPDDYETANQLNPNDPTDAARDNDADGLANLEEFRRGTNPNNPDTDGDGVDDATEIANGSDPRDPASRNRAPVIASQAVISASEQQPYSYQVQASDPDGDGISFSLLQSPVGMSISGAGLIQWTPGSNQTGFSTVIIRASDGRGGSALQQYRVNVLAQGIDFAVAAVDASAVTTDTQTLVIGGMVQVGIENRGGSFFAGSFSTLLFEDRNNNGTYQSGVDNFLGAGEFVGNIAGGVVVTLDVRVSGIVQFRDNAIYALVDSASQIPELDETNNIGNSGGQSLYQPPARDWQPVVKWEWNDTRAFPAAGVLHPPTVAPLIDTNGDTLINERDVPAVVFALSGNRNAGQPNELLAVRGDTGQVIFQVPCPDPIGWASSGHTPAIGDIDGDGRPEIVLSAFSRNPLFVYNNDGTIKWQLDNAAALNTARANVVLVDLDGDGKSEILHGEAAVNHDGTLRWDDSSSPIPIDVGGRNASRQAADIDLDGDPEIIAGPTALDHNGNPLWAWRAIPVTTDFSAQLSLNGGPFVEQFRTKMSLSPDEGWGGVANLDDEPFPEIVVVTGIALAFGQGRFESAIWIFNHDGSLHSGPFGLFQNVAQQTTFRVGAPTLADFDGDGDVEIAVPSAKAQTVAEFADPSRMFLSVHEKDGSLVWRRDLSINLLLVSAPPISAFDFDGDGAAELVFQDSQKLYILDGRTGAVLFEFGVNRLDGNQPYRYQTVADVDNDGSAEIIVPTYRFFQAAAARERSGVLVIGDVKDNWLQSRRVWNQWQYDVANVEEDSSIPRVARDGWQINNSLRQQTPIEDLHRFAAPDLTVSRVGINTQNCPASATLSARVGNGGSLHAPPGLKVNFYLGDPAAGGALIGTALTSKRLFQGEFEDVMLAWNAPVTGQVFATVNESVAAALISSNNLALLPHAWAQAGGYDPGSTVPINLRAFLGIDGQSTTRWTEYDPSRNLDPRHFYEARFPFPVNATSVTVQNQGATSAFGFRGTATLTFSNGFSIPIELGTAGEGSVLFSEQADITWIRLISSSVGSSGASLSEFMVGGSYTAPQFRINEGTGRLGNNKAASGPGLSPCDPSVNQPPVITSAPPITARTGVAYSYQAQAADPNNDPLSFALAGAPAGMTISAGGLIAWTPAGAQAGVAQVTVQVSDGRGGVAQQSFTIDVSSPPGVNRPPVFTSTPVTSATVGQVYQYDVNAADPDGDIVLFSLLGPPTGAAIDLFTGLISWTPSPSQVGAQFFTVEAQDGRGGWGLQSFTAQVATPTTPLSPRPPDRDGDGFDETVDCSDNNAAVNPARAEIPGNGLDDDCNPATPDAVPAGSVSCSIVSDKRSYDSNSLAQLTVRVRNVSANLSIAGLQGEVRVTDPGGQTVFATVVPINTLSPNDRFRATVAFTVGARAPGSYQAALELRAGPALICGSQAPFAVLSSALQGRALTGSISANPTVIEQGSTAGFNYQVSNVGNVDLPALSLKILVVNVATGLVAQTFTDQTSLNRGQSFTNTKNFNSAGAAAGDHLVVLQGESTGTSQTIGSAFLKINAPSNAAPDCSNARPSVATIWPPNHKMVAVSILGVADPDGDAVTITIDRIMQDEPTNGTGDGNTCPDAQGLGTSTAQLRAERSGNGNGRVYTIFFTARDGRGASCQGTVKVCVPHSNNRSCVDGGALFDSTSCATSLASFR